MVGRTEHRLLDMELSIGLYSPERTIVDAFRLRHELGADVANEALKRWLRRRAGRPATCSAVVPQGTNRAPSNDGDPTVTPASNPAISLATGASTGCSGPEQ